MKRTPLQKLGCLLLVGLLACSSLLVACGEKGTEASSSAASSDSSSAVEQNPYKDPETGLYTATLTGNTYDGTTITILTCSVNPQYNSEILENDYKTIGNPQEQIPEVLNVAYGNRTRFVEEQLGIKIEELQLHDGARKNGQMYKRIYEDNLVFTADYQLVVPCMYDCATLAQSGQLVNLYDLPGIQMEAPWWDQVFNKEMTINEQLYFTIGDIGTTNKSATAALTFNKVLYDRYALDAKYGGTPYDLVREGKWTLDTAIAMTREISSDLDSNGTIDYQDEYGWGGQLDDLWSLFYGSGSKLASTETNDGYPELTAYTQRSNTVMEKIQSLVQDKQHYVSANDYFSVIQWPTILLRDNFIAGKSLFYNGSMSTPIELRDMKDDFGLLPIPKGDETQDMYYSLVNPWVSNCFAVPLSLPESEYQMMSDFLNAMGAASANLVAGAYLEQCIEYIGSRDQDTIDMIEDYILPGRGCDIGMAYAWGGLDEMLHNMATKPIGSFASTYQEIEGVAKAALEATKEEFRMHSANKD